MHKWYLLHFLSDWYSQCFYRVQPCTVWVLHFKKVKGFLCFLWESSATVTNDSNRKGRNHDMIRLWLGNGIARISLRGSSKKYIPSSVKYLTPGKMSCRSSFLTVNSVSWLSSTLIWIYKRAAAVSNPIIMRSKATPQTLVQHGFFKKNVSFGGKLVLKLGF